METCVWRPLPPLITRPPHCVWRTITCIETAGHGRVFTAPIDVELGPTTVVQPDLIVILPGGAATITAQRIVGPPDLMVEVVSPGTASYDRRAKHDLYAATGVRECWIADPGHRVVELLTLAGTLYRAEHVCREVRVQMYRRARRGAQRMGFLQPAAVRTWSLVPDGTGDTASSGATPQRSTVAQAVVEL